MSERTFPNWLDAYLDYSDDGFTPPQFNEWACLNVIAGALERKVWLPWSDTFNYYPNLYTLLVSLPGAGKSTAINKAVGLLREVGKKDGSTLHMLPSQITEAEFVVQMGRATSFQIGSVIHLQCAGYYHASEASNSLKNVYGDFIACLTDFYDSPPFWEKSTRKDGRRSMENISVTLLAGSTFDYLSKLVSDENIMGGFASRLIYVLSRENTVRKQAFQSGFKSEEARQSRLAYRKALVSDLQQIHRLKGTFSFTPEFAAAWETWYYDFETKRKAEPSEKLQSLLVRVNTNLLKVSMLLSAAEGDDLVLKLNHFERAKSLMEPIAAQIPEIFRSSKALNINSQTGLNNAIIDTVSRRGTMSRQDLDKMLMARGFIGRHGSDTIDRMIKTGELRVLSVSPQAGEIFEFVGDLNNYL